MSEIDRRQKSKRILSWIINLAAVLFLASILYLGGGEVWRQILQADWRYLGAAFVSALLWNLVAAYRWALIARQGGPEAAACPFRYYFTYQMLGMLTGQVMPISVGMLGARPVALNLSRGVSLKRAALSVLLDKLFDVIQAVLLVVPVALYLAGWLQLSLALGLMAGSMAAGLAAFGLWYELALRGLGRLGSRLSVALAHLPLVGRLLRRLPQQIDRVTAENWIPNRLAIRAFGLTILLYVLMSARLFYIAQALHLQIPWYLLATGACVTQLTLIFSFTPGSVGFLEGGWTAVLSLAGLAPAEILLFLIGRRAFMLVFTLIQTLLAFAWIRESPARLFRAILSASRRPARGPEPAATS